MSRGGLKAVSGVTFLTLLAGLFSGILSLALPGSAGAQGTPPWEPDGSSVGGLIFYNAAGQQVTGGNITDSPIAAYVGGTSTIRAGDSVSTLYGYLPVNGQLPTQWSGEQLGSSTTYPDASAPAPLNTSTLPLEIGSTGDESIAQLQADYPNTDTSSDGYAGMYQLRLRTNAPRKTSLAQYDSADIFVSGNTWSVVYPVPTPVTTTTTLTASPSSPQVVGTSVTLTATVSPAVPGTVQFEDAGSDIGSPVTVSGGTASLTTSTLPVGTDDLSAVFTPATFLNYASSTGTASYTVVSIKVSTPNPPSAVVYKAYNTKLVAQGGTAPYVWSLASGTLPPGLKLSSLGVLSGTPTTVGTTSFTVGVKDSSKPAKQGTGVVTLTVNPMTVATTSLPNAPTYKSYSAKLTTLGGKSLYHWSLLSGALPAGLKLASTGAISGTPTVAGTSSFTVHVTDSAKPANTANATLSITVTPLTVTTKSLPNGVIKKSYSAKLTATGGKSTLTWSLTSGSLPAGLKLSTTGSITGVPTTAGTSTFTVGVHDSATPHNTASATLSITVT